MRDEPELPGASQFPPTRWTLIASARADAPARRIAMEELLGLYWKPLYCFARRKGLATDAAQDAVQGLLARLLERDFLARLDPTRGRFRSYLRTAMSHYLINQHERAAAQKRGGDVLTVGLDFDVAERRLDAAPTAAEHAFEREWALGIMERTLSRLQAEYDSGQRGGPFAVVAAFFGVGAEPPSYADAASTYDMSIPQLKAFLHRARVRYRALLRDEVGQTVADPAETDDEIHALMQALSG